MSSPPRAERSSDRPPPPLAHVVRAARTAAGLSERGLARRAGISQPTASALERGREPGLAVLQSILGALPGLDPCDVLGRARGPAPASARSWAFHARTIGYAADRVELEARVDPAGRVEATITTTGLAATDGSGATVPELLGAPFCGPHLQLMDAARGADRRGALEIAHEGVVHAFSWDARHGVRCRRRDEDGPVEASSALVEQCPFGRPFARGAWAWLDFPVRALRVVVTFASHPPVRVEPLAWPASLALSPQEPSSSWRDLWPAAPHVLAPDAEGRVVLEIEEPPPFHVLGLTWDEAPAPSDAPAAARAAATRARDPGRAVAAARCAAGMSRREMARRIAVSPATLSALEAGADCGRGVVLRCLDALPALAPGALLAPAEIPGDMTLDEAWEEQLRAFGMAADLESRDCVMTPRGDARLESLTRGLTWTPQAERHLRLRLGLARGPRSDADWALESIDARSDSDEPGADGAARVRVLRRGARGVLYDLRFDEASASHRVDVRRRLLVRGQFAMTPDAPHATRDARGRRAEAYYFEPTFPARRFEQSVRFPAGYWPDECTGAVTPRASLIEWGARDVGARLHGDGLRVEVDRRRRRLVMSVERPLVGYRYLLQWFLE